MRAALLCSQKVHPHPEVLTDEKIRPYVLHKIIHPQGTEKNICITEKFIHLRTNFYL